MHTNHNVWWPGTLLKQAISAHTLAVCQLTVCFEFQSRSEKEKDTIVVFTLQLIY